MILNSTESRNPAAEAIGTSVQITAFRCQSMGVTEEYAGLSGVVIASEDGESLVRLDKASHAKYTKIETRVFSEGLQDFAEEQWFASGLLEVVQESKGKMDEHTTMQICYLLASLEIDLSPVVNVRPWFPTKTEGVVTFRVVTADREIHYVSLPQGFSFKDEDLS